MKQYRGLKWPFVISETVIDGQGDSIGVPRIRLGPLVAQYPLGQDLIDRFHPFVEVEVHVTMEEPSARIIRRHVGDQHTHR